MRIVPGTVIAILLLVVLACTPAPGREGGSIPPSPPSAAPSAALASGVEGFVLAGPTCPVQRAEQSPCVRPLEGAVILAFEPSGSQAGRGTSDASGAYRIPLAPGTYVIRPQPVPATMGIGREQVVTVSSGAFTHLDIEYDTGIR